MIGAATHAVLEAFAAADWATGSVLLYACGAGSSRSYWHARASLTSVATLHVVCSLRHANSWTWLELLDWLSVSDANAGLVLALRLLVRAVGRLVLLLLLIHVGARVQGACRAGVGRWASCGAGAWLLDLVLLIHIA